MHAFTPQALLMSLEPRLSSMLSTTCGLRCSCATNHITSALRPKRSAMPGSLQSMHQRYHTSILHWIFWLKERKREKKQITFLSMSEYWDVIDELLLQTTDQWFQSKPTLIIFKHLITSFLHTSDSHRQRGLVVYPASKLTAVSDLDYVILCCAKCNAGPHKAVLRQTHRNQDSARHYHQTGQIKCMQYLL